MAKWFFCGHPKASLVWHQLVYGAICRKFGFTTSAFTQVSDVKTLEELDTDFVFYKSANYFMLPENVKGFHVVRDPRDMLVSGYFSTRYSHPSKGHLKLLDYRVCFVFIGEKEGFQVNPKESTTLLNPKY